jgi:hypothetical protein
LSNWLEEIHSGNISDIWAIKFGIREIFVVVCLETIHSGNVSTSSPMKFNLKLELGLGIIDSGNLVASFGQSDLALEIH